MNGRSLRYGNHNVPGKYPGLMRGALGHKSDPDEVESATSRQQASRLARAND